MSIAATARNSFRSSPFSSLKRHISSQSASPKLSLPPKKLRALISIYHEAEYFITPQNLSSAIDRAFLGEEDPTPGLPPAAEAPYEDIKLKLRRQRGSPMAGTWSDNEAQAMSSDWAQHDWSDTKSGREKQVIAALYGGNDGTGKPGLEMLQEESERLQNNIAEDDAHWQEKN